MDKGIRPETIRKFNELLPTRENSVKGNAKFRATVIAHAMEQFKISLASAATHYNHAFIEARKEAATKPELATLLVGLGRPEDKKGGRKKKAVETVTPQAASEDAGATGEVLNSNILGSTQEDSTPAATISTEAALVGLEGLQQTGDEQPQVDPLPEVTPVPELPQEPEAPVQKYSVKKVADGTIVCEDLTLEQANELIEAAKKAKKGKLELAA